MPLSLRKNGLTSLFKEVRVFKDGNGFDKDGRQVFETSKLLWKPQTLPPLEEPHERRQQNRYSPQITLEIS